MPHSIGKFTLLVALFVSVTQRGAAQPFENAADYMEHIYKANQALTAKYLVYLSAVSHGKSARKVEKRRFEVVNAINDTRMNIMGMPAWKGDKTLKDTSVAYLKTLNSVFNEDYAKIVNMEEIAEQSYDAMEAYMLAQEKAYEKLNQAAEKQHQTQKNFAAKNNINLVDGASDVQSKSKIANEVLGHANDVYLIFFKAYKQEAYMMDAITKKNLVSLEQSINSLQKFAAEGKTKLKDLEGYNGDDDLITATDKMMDYYETEAGKGSVMTDYLLKEEGFVKLKKQFDAKPAGKRTQQDIDQFNAAVNDINASLKTFNTTMADLNKKGASALNDWNKSYSKYLDEHMPKQQR